MYSIQYSHLKNRKQDPICMFTFCALNAVLNILDECTANHQCTGFSFIFDKSKHQGQRPCAYEVCWLGLCSHLFTVFTMHWIYYRLSAFPKTEHYCRLKATHLQAWLSLRLFIFHRNSDRTVWTLCYRVVFRATGSDKYTEWLKAGTRRWTGAFLICFIKRVFIQPIYCMQYCIISL